MDAIIGITGIGLIVIGVPICILILIVKLLKKTSTKKDIFRAVILFIAGIVLFFIGLLLPSDTSDNAISNSGTAELTLEDAKEESITIEKEEEGTTQTTINEATTEYDTAENAILENEVDKTEQTKADDNTGEIDIFKDKEYIINNLMIKYNTFAKSPIDEETMDRIERVGRPLNRMTITLDTGIFVMITYNDINETLFIDYQEETKDDTDLYNAVCDFTMAVDDNVNKKMMKSIWKEFKEGKYSNHYGEKGSVGEFEFICQTNVINNGDTRYNIKSEYKIK